MYFEKTSNNENIIGKSVEEARKIVPNPIRVKIEDGIEQIGDSSFQLSRINVEVKDGKIVRIIRRG